MPRLRPAGALAALALAALALPASAQDVVYTKAAKEKTITGIIVAESPEGITLKNRKGVVPAEEVEDVFYEVEPLSAKITAYQPAFNEEKKAATAVSDEERQKAIETALAKYQDALAKVDPKYTFALRHIEYKLARLHAVKAEGDPAEGPRAAAIAKLKEFTAKHPGGWQTPGALRALAQLQAEQRDFLGAEKTLAALQGLPVSEGAKQEAEFLVAQLSIKAGKHDEARKKFEALAAKLPKDSVAGQKARLAVAECLAAAKDLAGAEGLLKKFLAETKDADLKATAYNTLGVCYFQSQKYQEARRAFLWVDLIYNQNRAEHAKALYYLYRVFAQLNEGERAQANLESLLNDRQYAGLEYQRKAMQERSP